MSSRDDQQLYYKTQLEAGLLYQDFVVDCCWSILGLAVVQYGSRLYQQQVGESRTGVEVKWDNNYAKTGNIYIEVAEKASLRNGPFAPSGIYRKDNTWLYVIGNYDTVFIYSKQLLKMLHKSGKCREVGNKTSHGFLLAGAQTVTYAAQILYPNAEKKIGKLVSDLRMAASELHDMVEHPNEKHQLQLFGVAPSFGEASLGLIDEIAGRPRGISTPQTSHP